MDMMISMFWGIALFLSGFVMAEILAYVEKEKKRSKRQWKNGRY